MKEYFKQNKEFENKAKYPNTSKNNICEHLIIFSHNTLFAFVNFKN